MDTLPAGIWPLTLECAFLKTAAALTLVDAGAHTVAHEGPNAARHRAANY